MPSLLRRRCRCLLWLAGLATTAVAAEPVATLWPVEAPDRIGGLTTEVLGAPRAADGGVAFDGHADGLVVPVNPLAGVAAFTIEVLLRPDEGGGSEQRFFHFEADGGAGRRALLELRADGHGGWWLDTHLRAGDARRTLIDPSRVHPTGQWYWVALRYDGQTMAHFVDAAPELEGPVAIPPLGAGKISLGVRQTRVSWFKGVIRAVRFTPAALPAEQLQRVKR